MPEEFIGEPLQPAAETFDANRMAAGGPGLPRQFRWRSQLVSVAHVLGTWRETGPCHHGSDERYVRKHWFEVLTDSGLKMKIYFERHARSAKRNARWWLFSLERPAAQEAGAVDARQGSEKSGTRKSVAPGP